MEKNKIFLGPGQKIIISFVVLCVFMISLSFYINTSREGKIPVSIEAIPQDAKITIDGRSAYSGDNYLSPGKHTFKASKEGFKAQTIERVISEKVNMVGLVLDPESEEAKEIFKNSKAQQEREKVASAEASQKGAALGEENPIINFLPHTDIAGPFKIDYGFRDDDKNKAFIIISFSTPSGRQEAFKWIREKGVDPTTLDIRYQDFINPLTIELEQ